MVVDLRCEVDTGSVGGCLRGGGDAVVVVIHGGGFLKLFLLSFPWWLCGCFWWVVMAYWLVCLRGCLCSVLEMFRDDWGRLWRFGFE